MTKTWLEFQVFCRLEVHGLYLADWHLLIMDEPYGDTISAPDDYSNPMLTAVHWRMREINLAIQKLESDVCKVVEFKVMEKKK